MFSTIITLGDKVTIIQEEKDHEEQTKELVSSVLDFKEEDELHIGVPTEHLNEIPLRQGEVYRLCVYTKRGLYLYQGTVTGSYEEDKLKIGILKLSNPPEKLQRRQYYRLNKIMDVRYRVITVEGEETAEEQPLLVWNRALLSDLSGGGAMFYSKEELTKDKQMILKFHIRKDRKLKVVEVISNVISSLPAETREGEFETRVEFSNIDMAVRERIIKYIFEEDRKQIRRDKGLM